MTTEFIIAAAFKKMLATQPLEEITVKALVAQCDITRPTFYYHFRDIYDLLAWIYLNETIEGIDKAGTWQEAALKVGRYCLANRSLVRQTLESAGRDLLVDFLTHHLYTFHLRKLEELDANDGILEESRKSIASFYSSALIAILLEWIRAGMKEHLADKIEALAPYVGDYLNSAIKER